MDALRPGAGTEGGGNSGNPKADNGARSGFSLAGFLETLKNLAKRVFTHAVMLAGGVAVGFSAWDAQAGLCVYVGGICLVAGDISSRPVWVIPAATGAVQAGVLALCGIPLPQALFWGGAQSWLQRLGQKQFRPGAEWIALLLLLPLGISLLHGAPRPELICGSFAAMAALGMVLARLSSRKQTPAPEAARKPERAEPGAEPERLAAYRASLEAFRITIKKLPTSAWAVAASIATRTDGILNNMAGDPRDLEPGLRFLHRYFKAAEAVVDKHVILAREKAATPEVAEALARSEEMLRRLDAVFAKEQARLLENDVSDFSADLAVIDTLLKMDGR